MFLASHIFTKAISRRWLTVGGCVFAVFMASPVQADTVPYSSRALQQALDASNHIDLYTPKNNSNFNLGSSYFSGLASGVTPLDSAADFNNDQKLYALLIDGRYDFDYETLALSSPLHPYISGGMGMATAGRANGGNSLTASSGEVVPLFRLGGGVAYRLGQKWNMSLDYKTGVAASSAGDQVFTGRGQQSVDLQALNLGMSYAF